MVERPWFARPNEAFSDAKKCSQGGGQHQGIGNIRPPFLELTWRLRNLLRVPRRPSRRFFLVSPQQQDATAKIEGTAEQEKQEEEEQQQQQQQ
eukprot:CAMPEP_0206626060 /NCGR_PEP_ID=MMETSP0325_2-20121206/65087_1 /ASSEMBLY_ACC=CAM_ASM_000347 /TAXON_ID=2866 /ORGANISM="Crypthecodinium cohnii, Strain Seligo" /LENGTH=92 /DNA_ID=CAMNT_0054150325 /DNA_START=302 /DNA_END=577 /DNA_ORIENTATION=-